MMSLYRVLLVDDEAEIRMGISRHMAWEELGFTLVGEAENGQEALDLAEQLCPDLVLTDIQMPFLDGLELCKRLSVSLPATKFIIFSGFDEFSYAKEAIHIQVSEYILKPINREELSEILRKMKDSLDEERKKQQNLTKLQQQFQENIPLLQELFFVQLLSGRLKEENISNTMAPLGLSFSAPLFQIAIFHIRGDAIETELQPTALQKVIHEYFTWHFPWHCFFHGESLALLVGVAEEEINTLLQELQRLCQLALHYLDLTVSIGLGLPYHSLAQMRQSAQEGKETLEYRVLLSEGKAFYWGDLTPRHKNKLVFQESQEQALLRGVRLGTQEDLRQLVGEFVTNLYESEASLGECQLYFIEIITSLRREWYKTELEEIPLLLQQLEEEFSSKHVGTFQNQDALQDWLLMGCIALQEQHQKQLQDSTNQIICQAKQFIRTHYAQADLSVEVLCGQLHLSPTYFSTLFKRETSTNFTTFVTSVRMEQAKHRLLTTQDKTYLIGEQVGYQDSNYFSYVFKKYFGMSPTKFRSAEGERKGQVCSFFP